MTALQRARIAEALVALSEAEALNPTLSILELCTIVGISEADYAHAARRAYVTRRHNRAAQPRRDPIKVEHPTIEQKHCGICKTLKPLQAFNARDRQGRPKYACADCLKRYQRQRYLRIEQRDALIAATFTVSAQDDVHAKCCRVCLAPLQIGEQVVLLGDLRHADCEA